jgi:protein arginine kinase activator
MSQERCDRCQSPATTHIKEISNGQMTEVHLCERCAAEAGFVPQSHLPVSEILSQLIQKQSLLSDKAAARCAECGMTWQEFKDTGLLGCLKDYEIFAPQLEGVIKNAQQGAMHHTGKHPHSSAAGGSQAVKLRISEIVRLKKQLAHAVESESYEEAAKLRDQIQTLEHPE